MHSADRTCHFGANLQVVEKVPLVIMRHQFTALFTGEPLAISLHDRTYPIFEEKGLAIGGCHDSKKGAQEVMLVQKALRYRGVAIDHMRWPAKVLLPIISVLASGWVERADDLVEPSSPFHPILQSLEKKADDLLLVLREEDQLFPPLHGFGIVKLDGPIIRAFYFMNHWLRSLSGRISATRNK
jgi:hypothetical protein